MAKTDKRIIEINGVKLEIDMRTAKRVEEYRVGDRVKILVRDWNKKYTSYPACIVGFDDFKNLPTVVIAYVDGSTVKLAHLNSQSEDIELAPMNEDEVLPARETVLAQFDAQIQGKQRELDTLIGQRSYFLARFGSAFIAADTEAAG